MRHRPEQLPHRLAIVRHVLQDMAANEDVEHAVLERQSSNVCGNLRRPRSEGEGRVTDTGNIAQQARHAWFGSEMQQARPGRQGGQPMSTAQVFPEEPVPLQAVTPWTTRRGSHRCAESREVRRAPAANAAAFSSASEGKKQI